MKKEWVSHLEMKIMFDFDEVVDKIPVLDIPEEFISAEYYELEKAIRNYTKIKNSNIYTASHGQRKIFTKRVLRNCIYHF